MEEVDSWETLVFLHQTAQYHIPVVFINIQHHMNLKSYRVYLLLFFIYSWYIRIVVEIYQTTYCPSDPRPPRPSDVVIEDGLCGQYSVERL